MWQNQVHWQEGLEWHARTIDRELNKICIKHNDHVSLSIPALVKHPHGKYLLSEYALKQNASAGQVQEIIRLLDAPIGKYVNLHSVTCYRDRKSLIFAPSNSKEPIWMAIPSCGEYEFRGRLIVEECVEMNSLVTDEKSIYLDADRIEWPLLIRPWQEGDYFYPYGLNKKKKVARLLIDSKIALPHKSDVHVMLSGNYILWVVDIRADHRFRITEKTKKIIKITHAH
jgi:tRNA(Ile)-lysidine synthase